MEEEAGARLELHSRQQFLLEEGPKKTKSVKSCLTQKGTAKEPFEGISLLFFFFFAGNALKRVK